MSTVRGQKLNVVEQAELAAKAGYDSIEPWLREIDAFVKQGGSLKDLGKRIRDLGLTVESAIGFARWIVDDDEERRRTGETSFSHHSWPHGRPVVPAGRRRGSCRREPPTGRSERRQLCSRGRGRGGHRASATRRG
ncbi:MAG: hypothetical protein IIA08_05990 [Proteobacteria bacterium]|nr:hypothetical protein [Pseudomonadota bacterium]